MAMAHVHCVCARSVCVCARAHVCVGQGQHAGLTLGIQAAIWSKKAESSQKDNASSSPTVLWESGHEGSPACSHLSQAGLQKEHNRRRPKGSSE